MTIKMKDGWLVANWYQLFNLKKPYRNSIDVVKSTWEHRATKHVYRSPGSVYDLGSTFRYRFRTSKNHFHALIPATGHGLKGHAIYSSAVTCPSVFMANNLMEVLLKLPTRDPVYAEIRKLLSVVVGKVLTSYDFDIVLTDLKYPKCVLPSSFPEDKIYRMDYVYDKPLRIPALRIENAAMNNHGPVPLRVLDSDALSIMPIDNTNIDMSVFPKDSKILILSGLNLFYSAYMANLLRKEGIQQVLPISIFRIHHSAIKDRNKIKTP